MYYYRLQCRGARILSFFSRLLPRIPVREQHSLSSCRTGSAAAVIELTSLSIQNTGTPASLLSALLATELSASAGLNTALCNLKQSHFQNDLVQEKCYSGSRKSAHNRGPALWQRLSLQGIQPGIIERGHDHCHFWAAFKFVYCACANTIVNAAASHQKLIFSYSNPFEGDRPIISSVVIILFSEIP